MKKFILTPMAALLKALLPGDSSGFPAGGARPAPRPAPARTPSFSAPRPAPVYHPAPVARPVQRPVAPPIAPPAARPAFVPQPRPAVIGGNTVVRPNVGGNTINRGNFNNVNVNRNLNVNRALVNNGINVNRPNGIYRPGYAYYHNYYGSWHHGYWNSWNYRPWLWGGAGFATGLILGSTAPAVVYANPYYDPGPDIVPVYDYSQPIAVPQPVEVPSVPVDGDVPPPPDQPAPPQPPVQPSDENSTAAVNLLNESRDAFMKNDYDKAQQAIDKAVKLLPNDPTLHEFRALVLFARADYREAAAAIYAVLAVGPGWDWDTLRTRSTRTYRLTPSSFGLSKTSVKPIRKRPAPAFCWRTIT